MNIFGHTDEKDMAEGIRKGNNRAMRSFYASFGSQLTAVCSRYISDEDDVKDVMQDAMISIIQHIDNFTYHGKGSLRAWATRIVVNQALNFIKSRQRFDETSPSRASNFRSTTIRLSPSETPVTTRLRTTATPSSMAT